MENFIFCAVVWFYFNFIYFIKIRFILRLAKMSPYKGDDTPTFMDNKGEP